jgi:D-xylono/L-arabinono-1,4-lactonase
MGLQVVPVANYHCEVGENPLWDERTGRLYWVDIDTGRLFRAHDETLEHECFFRGDKIGGFTFQEDGSLLLFETNRIALLEAGRRRVLLDGIDSDMVRFNDVIADVEGRVYAGTIGRTKESGGLYRVDRDLRVTCLWKGTGCANGMGFTGDLARFYWTCSTKRRIYVSDYDRETGALENRRVFYEAPEAEGTPDGLTIDVRDHVYSARWGGSSVLEITPSGRVVGRIDLPVTRVSSAAFGGPELDTLYVTTAGGREDSTTADGTLYRVKLDTKGRIEFRSHIGL